MAKECVICHRPISDNKKIPLCEYHRKVVKESGKRVAKAGIETTAAVVGVAKLGVDYVKKNPEVVKEVGKKVATVLSKIPRL